MRLPYNLGPHTLSQDPRKKKKEKKLGDVDSFFIIFTKYNLSFGCHSFGTINTVKS
jgi:hypothetical protein